MIESTGDPAVDAVLADYARATSAVNALDLTALVRLDSPSTGLHAVARTVESIRRSSAVFDSHYVAAVEVGDEPARYARPSTTAFLREQLRLSAGEAKRRVDLAHAITPQVAFTGEVLPAACPTLAAGITTGEVSAEHARIILDTIGQLPGPVREAAGHVVEAEMATAATKVTPADLEVLARDVLVRADPDGTLRDIDHAHKQRGLRLWKKRGQAGYTLQADLDQETGEAARVVLDAWSKPAPAAPAQSADADSGESEWADQGQACGTSPGSGTVVEPLAGRDERPHQVRMHDAFSDVLKAILNSGDLPACGGTPAAIIWHIDDQVLRNRYGFAISEHGTLLPVGDALRVCDQTQLYVLIENSKGVPLYLGRTNRIATPGQTIALAARDRGCSFPGCDRPPSHCQRHHVLDWLYDGLTDIDNLTLLCGYHHREHAKRGWTCQMRDGLPHWRPPAWLDPTQTPIRNTRHFTLPTDRTDPGQAETETETVAGASSETKGDDRDIAIPDGWLPDTG